MKKLFIVLFVLISPYLFAADLNIQPVYGFQRNYHVEPKPARYKTEVFLGVRATYGVPLLKLEGEITQSNSEDEIGDTKAKYSTQSLMTGLILTPLNGQYYSIYMRGGARFQKKTTELTQNGETSSTTDGPNLDPYAGTGISINVGGIFNLTASATLVYNRNAEASEQYDTRYTLGAGFSIDNNTKFGD